jgi:hypothetical protein
MKRFLIATSIMMALVLALAVVAFVFVQQALAPEVSDEVLPREVPVSESPRDAAPSTPSTPTSPAASPDFEPPSPAVAVPTVPVVTEPIPLSSLPLSDTQKELLRGAGVDPETFVITPEMIGCAEERLGAARFAEIVAGDAPGPTEVFSLLRCL